jgi:uncharacterized membrane protein YbhN (UPF0104 family)
MTGPTLWRGPRARGANRGRGPQGDATGSSASGDAGDPVTRPGPRRPGSALRATLRAAAGALLVAVLVWRLGAGPLMVALRNIRPATLVVAIGLGGVTTVCIAWRWRVVAAALGAPLPPHTAVPAYYRSIFLNSTLPAGIVGDVARAVQYGTRAVIYDRVAGQATQLALTAVVLAVTPSPVRAFLPAAIAAGLLGCGVVLYVRRRAWLGWLTWRTALVAFAASSVVVAGHTATFVLAARTAGVPAPTTEVVALGLVALLAMSVPLSLAGWGPREGVTAWLFGAAGLGAAQGLATSVVYGVLALAAALPGAGFLLAVTSRARSKVR